MRRRNQRVIWLASTTLFFSAFSFAAGFGIRGLYGLVATGRFAPGNLTAGRGFGTRLASTSPGAGEPDLRPATGIWKPVHDGSSR